MCFRSIFILLSSLMLAACTVGPNFKRPPTPPVNTYTPTPLPSKTASSPGPGGKTQHFAWNRDIPGEWWTVFHSKELNNLILCGIANSPNLKAAEAALRQANENLNVQIGNLYYPAVDATLGAQRERFSRAIFGQEDTARTPNTFNLFNASVSVSYMLDLFGGNRRQVEAYRALVEFQGYEFEAAYLTLTSNIVTTAIAVASLRAQIQATKELIDLQEKQLKITNTQFTLGSVAKTAVLAQETQLAQNRALLHPLEKVLAQNSHALSVLVGQFPGEAPMPAFDLNKLNLPSELPITLPSCLVRQRPDIRASEALLHQASAQIGVAIANMFPQITLNANYGFQSNKLNQLFTQDASVWSFGAQLLQPLFHGGALIAQKRASVAGYEVAEAQYRQTVLLAFQNVADVLRALEQDALALKAETEAETSALKALNLVQEQFKLGAVNYVELLIANTQYDRAKISRIRAQAQRYADTAALFQALGGGWWNRNIDIVEEGLS